MTNVLNGQKKNFSHFNWFIFILNGRKKYILTESIYGLRWNGKSIINWYVVVEKKMVSFLLFQFNQYNVCDTLCAEYDVTTIAFLIYTLRTDDWYVCVSPFFAHCFIEKMYYSRRIVENNNGNLIKCTHDHNAHHDRLTIWYSKWTSLRRNHHQCTRMRKEDCLCIISFWLFFLIYKIEIKIYIIEICGA